MKTLTPCVSSHVFLRLCFALAALLVFPAPSYAAEFSEKIFCEHFKRNKSLQAFLFDETGTKLLSHFDLGQLDVTTDRFDADYLMSSKRFRLVLFPRKLRFQSLASGALINGKAIKPRCSSTNEYLLEAGVIPTKTGPGKFDSDVLPFKIFDRADLEHPTIKKSYQEQITGHLSMPWLELDEFSVSRATLKTLFGLGNNGMGNNNVKMTLKNTGNRSLRFSRWEGVDDKQDREITIQENSCENIQLESRGHCDLSITKSSVKPLSKKFYSWGTTASGPASRGR